MSGPATSQRGLVTCEDCGCEIGAGPNPARQPIAPLNQEGARGLAAGEPDLHINFTDRCHCHDVWLHMFGHNHQAGQQ